MEKTFKKAGDNISLAVSVVTLVSMLVMCVHFIAGIDKANAIQETQINSINARLDKIEAKIDQLFYKKDRA